MRDDDGFENIRCALNLLSGKGGCMDGNEDKDVKKYRELRVAIVANGYEVLASDRDHLDISRSSEVYVAETKDSLLQIIESILK